MAAVFGNAKTVDTVWYTTNFIPSDMVQNPHTHKRTHARYTFHYNVYNNKYTKDYKTALSKITNADWAILMQNETTQ